MAEASISEDHFMCSVCLDLLKDPVTVPCGHTYCMRCITDCWNPEDQTGIYSCPQCRQTFSPRPVLAKNIILTKVMEKLKRDELERFCTRGLEKISERVRHTEIILSPELKTRDQFLKYSLQLTLDLNTVNKHLSLSEGNREITNTNTQQRQYRDHPDRFDNVRQVLCRESVCGRSYWEIEWTGRVVYISVSYKSIRRKGRGDECVFGCNDQSWSLICSRSSYSFRHNNISTDLSVKLLRSDRIGVYVDERAGILSFYSVSDTMTLIHSISTTFTQPLYPGFNVCYKSSVKLCDQ